MLCKGSRMLPRRIGEKPPRGRKSKEPCRETGLLCVEHTRLELVTS